MQLQPVAKIFLVCRVYTCRFDNQSLNKKLVCIFYVVKFTRYMVYEEDKKPV